MRISALLNESPGRSPRQSGALQRHSRLSGSRSAAEIHSDSTPKPRRRKSTERAAPNDPSRYKDAKDAPKFELGQVNGAVKFPPFEACSQEQRRALKKMNVFPDQDIAAYPRHIPYSSDKKDFQLQTGRDSFEVFQYTFKCNVAGKAWTVMWDYNIGLVRITPFFKALGCGKTVPAKAIARSPGLKEMCHSITGGALAAQGYWMPFEAAKALAATFCWAIRNALIPLFGPSFPSICITPEEPNYYMFTVDAKIVRQCQEDVNGWTGETKIRSTMDTCSGDESQSDPPHTPEPSDYEAFPNAPLICGPRPHNSDSSSPTAETPRASNQLRHTSMRYHTADSPASPALSNSSTTTSTALSFTTQTTTSGCASSTGKRPWSDIEGNANGDVVAYGAKTSSNVESSSFGKAKRCKVGTFSVDEARAAYMLLQLSMGRHC